jgi:hypothetical protein
MCPNLVLSASPEVTAPASAWTPVAVVFPFGKFLQVLISQHAVHWRLKLSTNQSDELHRDIIGPSVHKKGA